MCLIETSTRKANTKSLCFITYSYQQSFCLFVLYWCYFSLHHNEYKCTTRHQERTSFITKTNFTDTVVYTNVLCWSSTCEKDLIVLMISVCVNGSSLYVLLYKVPILIRIKQENNKHIDLQGNSKQNILYEMAILKTQTHSTNGKKKPKRPYHITRSCLCKWFWFSWIVVIHISREVTH